MNPSSLSLRLLVLLAFAGVGIACSSAESPSSSSSSGGGGPGGTGATNGDTPASRAGAYRGSYKGDGSGKVTMTLSNDGKLDAIVAVGSKDYPADGQVEADGSVSVGVATGEGVVVTFDGKFAGGAASGTWRSSISTSGTWSVAK